MKKLLQPFILLLALMAVPLAANAQIHADVNGDGEVTIADINFVIDAILNSSTSANADVNGDGEVTIADINTVIEEILSGSIIPPQPHGDFGEIPEDIMASLAKWGMNINYGDEPPVLNGTYVMETIDSIAFVGPYNQWLEYGDEEYMIEFEMFWKMIVSFMNQYDNHITTISVPFYDPYEPDYYEPEEIVYLEDMTIMGQGNKFTMGIYFEDTYILPGEGIGVVFSGEVDGQNIKNMQLASINVTPTNSGREVFLAILRDHDGISYPTYWVPDDDWGDDDWDSHILTPKTNGLNSLIKSLMLKKTIKSRK